MGIHNLESLDGTKVWDAFAELQNFSQTNPKPKVKKLLISTAPKFELTNDPRCATYNPKTDVIEIGLANASEVPTLYYLKALAHSTMHRCRLKRDVKLMDSQSRLSGVSTYDEVREEITALVATLAMSSVLNYQTGNLIIAVEKSLDRQIDKGIKLHPRKSSKYKMNWGEVTDIAKYYIDKGSHYKVDNAMRSVKAILKTKFKGRMR